MSLSASRSNTTAPDVVGGALKKGKDRMTRQQERRQQLELMNHAANGTGPFAEDAPLWDLDLDPAVVTWGGEDRNDANSSSGRREISGDDGRGEDDATVINESIMDYDEHRVVFYTRPAVKVLHPEHAPGLISGVMEQQKQWQKQQQQQQGAKRERKSDGMK